MTASLVFGALWTLGLCAPAVSVVEVISGLHLVRNIVVSIGRYNVFSGGALFWGCLAQCLLVAAFSQGVPYGMVAARPLRGAAGSTRSLAPPGLSHKGCLA